MAMPWPWIHSTLYHGVTSKLCVWEVYGTFTFERPLLYTDIHGTFFRPRIGVSFGKCDLYVERKWNVSGTQDVYLERKWNAMVFFGR